LAAHLAAGRDGIRLRRSVHHVPQTLDPNV
jgi:hypothetical protein